MSTSNYPPDWRDPDYLSHPQCETCEGTGVVTNDFDQKVSCPDCAGTGYEEPEDARFEDDVI